ncbi:MAG: hypothetical protein MUE60_01810 [Candidatus Eisenbacteria bacterium]|nr:hypothetical protein [Candidatus Eisenbacteria bacterium]
MIRRRAVFAALVALVGALGCGEEPLVSHWADLRPVIDGDGAEWPISYMAYVDETRGVIGVTNDDSTAYLLFRFRDQKTARKAMVGGVTAWWSPRGSKDREIGIRFAPVVLLRDILSGQPAAGGEWEGRPDSSQSPHQPPPDGGPGGTTGSESERGDGWAPPGRGFGRSDWPTPAEGVLHPDVRLVTAKDPIGTDEWSDQRLRAQSGYRKGTYTYELALPLGAGSEIGTMAGEDGKIRFAVSLGGVPEDDKDLLNARGQGPGRRPDSGEEGSDEGRDGGAGGPAGMSGGGGGRGPGGRGPGAMMLNPLAELKETVDVSFVITLAERAQ